MCIVALNSEDTMTTSKEVVSEWIKLHATDTPQGTRWRREGGDPQPQTKSEHVLMREHGEAKSRCRKCPQPCPRVKC